MKVAIHGNFDQERHLDKIGRFFSIIEQRGLEALVREDFAGYLRAHGIDLCGGIPVDSFPDDVAAVVSIGGDGTFLRAAQWVGDREIPILGINTGHLGFLSSYKLEETSLLAEVILSGTGVVEDRMLLKVEGEDVPDDFWPYVINEVAVVKGDTTSMVSIRTSIDDCFLTEYKADGLVLATPTGSTAYNLSVGGPILQPTLHNIILSPIAPHSLTVRPLVIGADSRVEMKVFGRGKECHVGVDGRTFVIPGNGELLYVSRAPFSLKVLRRPDTDFSSIIRNKLLWGKR